MRLPGSQSSEQAGAESPLAPEAFTGSGVAQRAERIRAATAGARLLTVAPEIAPDLDRESGRGHYTGTVAFGPGVWPGAAEQQEAPREPSRLAASRLRELWKEAARGRSGTPVPR